MRHMIASNYPSTSQSHVTVSYKKVSPRLHRQCNCNVRNTFFPKTLRVKGSWIVKYYYAGLLRLRRFCGRGRKRGTWKSAGFGAIPVRGRNAFSFEIYSVRVSSLFGRLYFKKMKNCVPEFTREPPPRLCSVSFSFRPDGRSD